MPWSGFTLIWPDKNKKYNFPIHVNLCKDEFTVTVTHPQHYTQWKCDKNKQK